MEGSIRILETFASKAVVFNSPQNYPLSLANKLVRFKDAPLESEHELSVLEWGAGAREWVRLSLFNYTIPGLSILIF